MKKVLALAVLTGGCTVMAKIGHDPVTINAPHPPVSTATPASTPEPSPTPSKLEFEINPLDEKDIKIATPISCQAIEGGKCFDVDGREVKRRVR